MVLGFVLVFPASAAFAKGAFAAVLAFAGYHGLRSPEIRRGCCDLLGPLLRSGKK